MILIVANRRPRYNAAIHGMWLDQCPVPWEVYGPNLQGITRTPIAAYDPSIRVDDLARQIGASCIIAYRGGPRDMRWFAEQKLSVPFVLIDVDFCYFRSSADKEKLHQAAALHCVRHPNDLEHSRNPSKTVLPFSVDPTIYRQFPAGGRLTKICLSASSKSQTAYTIRREAMALLRPARKRLYLHRQAEFYGRHFAALTCNNGKWRLLNAKHFEITACGTLLFTPGLNGVEHYLPAGSYVQYREDCSDLADLWQRVRMNLPEWQRRAQAAARHVHANHTHAIRWLELLSAMRSAGLKL